MVRSQEGNLDRKCVLYLAQWGRALCACVAFSHVYDGRCKKF